jgi:peroxiredoxin Q/BCP
VTYIIDKKGVVRHIFSSQFQPEKHIEEALRILEGLEKE